MALTNAEKIASNIVKYNAARPYFGQLTGEALTRAKQWLVEHEYGSMVSLHIGDINGDVICNALWRQLSYNPLRFGDVSPFVYDGRNNLYRFARQGAVVDVDSDAQGVLARLQAKVRYFMTLNAAANRQWRDTLETDNGVVRLVDATSAPCRAMGALQDCVRTIIAPQNGSDLRGSVRYRREILARLQALYPEQFGLPQR